MAGSPTPISGDAIRLQVEKILASPRFAHSGRLKRFLRFSVDEALAGRGENLKEYVIALAVFDKDASHDPGADPIVRVEARRLRARLKEYYETDGRNDPVRIDIPKGAYVPIFQRVVATPPRRRRNIALAFAVVALLTAAAIAAFLPFRETPTPSREFVLRRLTSDAGLTTQPALSPDGKLVAYASDRGGDGDLEIWVQPTGGGDPLRLTHIPADDHEPAFSPDSARIAFRSERNGGGVFSVPAQGGEVRLLAEHGRNPRFSPDGNWVAYWVGSAGGDLLPSDGKIFLVPAAGGTPRPFESEFPSAVTPVWSPDGKYILFEAMLDPDTAIDRKVEWWTAPVAGGKADKTGLGELLRRQGLTILPNAGPPLWNRDLLLFTAHSGDTTNLWQVRFSPRTRRVGGSAQRLTFGSALEMYPSAAAGRIAFTSLNQNNDLWSQPVDRREGVAVGEMQRLTEGPAHDIFPSISADGNRIAYLSDKKGNLDVWSKNLRSGVETAVAAGGVPKRYPLISPSGSRIIYGEQAGGYSAGYLVSAAGGDPQKICESCTQAWDWSPDESEILVQQQHGSAPLGVDLLKPPSRQTAPFLQHPKWNLSNPRFSPDGRWIVFHAIVGPVRRQIFVAPGAAGAGESQWVPITDGQGLDRNAVFSPDASLLYFLSERDGFRCIWAQRLDRHSRPQGAAFAVLHLHNSKRSLGAGGTGAIGLAAAPGKLVFSAAEFTGNIWILQ